MGKITLIVELFLRSILPPFYSFSMIEGVCKKKLTKKPIDKDVLWVLGNLYVNYKKFDQARHPLETLYKMDTRIRSVTLLLARVYYNLNQYDKVKEILMDKEILLPNDIENYYLGDSLIQLKEFELSLEFLSIYVNYHKDKYVPFVKLGYAYYMLGLFSLAMDAYKIAKRIDPTNNEIKKSIEMCRKKMLEKHR